MGSEPFPYPGTLAARRIASAAKPRSRVLRLGAGFIGCIIMEAILGREASLTVVEMSDRVLPRMMPPVAAALIKRWCETKGVRIHTSARVVQIDRNANGLRARLERGEELDIDVVYLGDGHAAKDRLPRGQWYSVLRGNQDAKTASIRMRKCRRVRDGRRA